MIMSLSIEQALDKIYEALKGAETDGQGSIEYSLTKIVETLETGSNVNLPAVTSDDNGDVLTVVEGNWSKADIPSQLPTVTTTDNGDVLTVVEGSWAKAAPSVAGILRVTMTIDFGTDQWSSDKTFAEIYSAYESGAFLYAISNVGDVYALTAIGETECIFTNTYYEDGTLYGDDLTITSEGVSPSGWTIVSAGS